MNSINIENKNLIELDQLEAQKIEGGIIQVLIAGYLLYEIGVGVGKALYYATQ